MKRTFKLMLTAVLAIAMLTSFAFAEEVTATEGASEESVISVHKEADHLEGFSDAPAEDSWMYSGLNCVAGNEIMVGHNGLIRPGDSLTRAELVTMMVRVLGAEQFSGDLTKFADMNRNAWYYDNISAGVSINIINGSGNKMMPEAAITREQTFAILARTFLLIGDDANAIGSFNDASSVSAWAKNATNALIEAKVVLGDARNTLRPQANVTRAEFAAMLDRIACYFAKGDVDYNGKVIEGSVIIRDASVDLTGAIINGNVYITEAVGDEAIDLSGVTINGKIAIRSGNVKVADADEDKVVRPDDMPKEDTPVVVPPVTDDKDSGKETPNVATTPSRPSGPAATIKDGTYITYSYNGAAEQKLYAEVDNNVVTFDFGALFIEIGQANGGEVDATKLIFKDLYVESNKKALCKHGLASFYTNEENDLGVLLEQVAGATNNVLVPITDEGTSYAELCAKMAEADLANQILPELFDELNIDVESDEKAVFCGFVGSADFDFCMIVAQPRG